MSHYLFLPFLNHPTFHFVSLSNHQIHQQRTKLCCSQNVTCRAVFTSFSLCTFIFVNSSHTDGLFNEKRSSLARLCALSRQSVAPACLYFLDAAARRRQVVGRAIVPPALRYTTQYVQAAAGVSAGRRMCGAPCLAAELYVVSISPSHGSTQCSAE